MKNAEEQAQAFDRGSWSGRTSPELSAPTKGKISRRCSKKPSGLSRKSNPIFLFLTEDGITRAVSWETDSASLGAYSTHSFGESPSVVVESHLSQILEAAPHPKYSLSVKACEGILRRAEHRGKILPPLLQNALEMQILSKHTATVQKHTAYKETASTEPTPQDATVEGGRKV